MGRKRASPGRAFRRGSRKVERSNGTYLFVDVTIAKNAAVGAASDDFLRPSRKEKRQRRFVWKNGAIRVWDDFRDSMPDDVIYLDFAGPLLRTGTRRTTIPPKSKGMYDPTKTRSYHGGDFRRDSESGFRISNRWASPRSG